MPDEKLTSVIIPFLGKWELTHARMMDLFYHLPDNGEIILINDATPDWDADGAIGWWQDTFSAKRPSVQVRYKKNQENLGFGGSMNKGAKAAHGSFLVFLSNDVLVSRDVFTPIVEKLSLEPKTLVGGQLINWPAGWNEFEIDGTKIVVPYLGGWLLACTKEAWEELGGFDPVYGKFDYEDLDISTKALSLGYKLHPLNSLHLSHLSGTTIRTLPVDRMAITTKNKEAYIQKWKKELPKIHERIAEIRNEQLIGERV